MNWVQQEALLFQYFVSGVLKKNQLIFVWLSLLSEYSTLVERLSVQLTSMTNDGNIHQQTPVYKISINNLATKMRKKKKSYMLNKIA